MGKFRPVQIDHSLLDALRIGSESALDTILKKHGRKLLYFAQSIVKKPEIAEEVVVDSMVKLWEHRETFETSDSVSAFLYVVIKNLGINYIKSSYASREYDYELTETLESLDPDAYAKIVRTELLQSIYDEVSKLPEKQREVFKLTYFEELGTEEICEKLNMSAPAVFTNRFRALESLRLVFKEKNMWLGLVVLQMLLSKH
ncbi:RNA polymerase sigma factor [Sphingobacterium pedocola]|uniref:RNA polymerase subunit sigma-70 n=1 Tax=Sphingobacterium pedocola TaxID=2082722 RepID=A0ABR9T9H3_9SPHI|nr:sigma-70 family RNA polymerase sigma factor [Sphingobacterium pedocola]MBE8721998.1 hypothetical protein [Sphingobacterium pedocola]